MENWTPEQNLLLSCLLDDVTGTEEMVKMRQDFCKIHDCINSCRSDSVNWYFTGSQAEGLDLPGSDIDFMFEINNAGNIEVSESLQDLVHSTQSNKFLITTDNVPPAFAMLKSVTVQDPCLPRITIMLGINDAYLGSQQFMSLSPLLESKKGTHRIQGPSVESRTEYHDNSLPGVDQVSSILCKFWPTSAAEWKDRPRHHGWPTQRDKESIEAFGCHLVPVGHPLSTRKSLEWRFSFSIAERTLVWSFNHTQLQCYAVMKLILKEFIKTKCSDTHKSVLCSYFIKTFLFWQFERTELSFWQPTKLTTCIMYLSNAFYDCVKTGVLRHYFVPRFNLLEIKLTREAQFEILHLLGMVLEIGLPVLGECDSLSVVFLKFCQASDINQCIARKEEIRRFDVLNHDSGSIQLFTVKLLSIIHSQHGKTSYEKMTTAVIRLINEGHCSTALSVFAIRHLCRLITIARLFSCFHHGHKCIYHYTNILNNNVYGTDIASSKLWLATFWLQRGDYGRSVQTICDIVSSIPPYALYYSGPGIKTNDDSKQLYVDRYCGRNTDILYRAKEAWLSDMYITYSQYSVMPRAIQIELDQHDPLAPIWISPFVYAYYLMFLCYHRLGQYDNRNRALLQLLYTIIDDERCGKNRHYSFNVAGYCLLMAGYVEFARHTFLVSAHLTKIQPALGYDKYNAAYAYLSCM